jgi:hypothetical protein
LKGSGEVAAEHAGGAGDQDLHDGGILAKHRSGLRFGPLAAFGSLAADV